MDGGAWWAMVHEIVRVRHDLVIKANQRRVFKTFSKLSHQGEPPVCLDACQRYLGQCTPARLTPLSGLHAPRVAFGTSQRWVGPEVG